MSLRAFTIISLFFIFSLFSKDRRHLATAAAFPSAGAAPNASQTMAETGVRSRRKLALTFSEVSHVATTEPTGLSPITSMATIDPVSICYQNGVASLQMNRGHQSTAMSRHL